MGSLCPLPMRIRLAGRPESGAKATALSRNAGLARDQASPHRAKRLDSESLRERAAARYRRFPPGRPPFQNEFPSVFAALRRDQSAFGVAAFGRKPPFELRHSLRRLPRRRYVNHFAVLKPPDVPASTTHNFPSSFSRSSPAARVRTAFSKSSRAGLRGNRKMAMPE